MISKDFLTLLVCPVSKQPLIPSPDGAELWCIASNMAYPVADDIPILLEERGRKLTAEETASLAK